MAEARSYQMEKYYARKAMGRCPRCGKKLPADEEHIMCADCRAGVRQLAAYNAAKMTDEQRAELNAKAREKQKKIRERLRAEGRCADCGAPSPDRYFCAACTAKRKAQKAARDAAKK